MTPEAVIADIKTWPIGRRVKVSQLVKFDYNDRGEREPMPIEAPDGWLYYVGWGYAPVGTYSSGYFDRLFGDGDQPPELRITGTVFFMKLKTNPRGRELRCLPWHIVQKECP